jgi:KDO2-lipid IV(A) lauroyltransferase
MRSILFYIFYVINWTITLLPIRVLYLFSDFLFLLLYYFPGYRRKIVAENLRNAFPGKSESERKVIAKRFYRHLADIFIEILKMTHISSASLGKHITYENTGLLKRLFDEGRDVVAVLGHYGNWEWLASLPLLTKHQCLAIYKPLKNKHFDRFLTILRARHGMILTPMSMIVRDLIKRKKNGVPTLTSFLADQTPARGDIHYWTSFMNQDTPVYLGAEKIASKYDMAMIFFNMEKKRRGKYTVNIELLYEHTSGVPEHEITERHVRRLEEIITEKPEYWIWSHRRWKYKRESANG